MLNGLWRGRGKYIFQNKILDVRPPLESLLMFLLLPTVSAIFLSAKNETDVVLGLPWSCTLGGNTKWQDNRQ